MGGQKYYYKSIKLTFGSSEEVVRFLDLVTRKIKVFQMYAKTRGSNNVELILLGDPYEVNLAISEIKKMAKTVREMYRKVRGLSTYDQRIILDAAKIEAAIPLDVAYKTLEFLGYRVEVTRDGKIRTDATLGDIVKTVEQISRLYKEMMDMDITPQAKRIIAIYSTVVDRDIEESISDLLNLGLLKIFESEERKLIVLSYSYEESLKKLREIISNIKEHPEILLTTGKKSIETTEEEEEKLEEIKRRILGEGVIELRDVIEFREDGKSSEERRLE